jgi:TPR repeat protein
MKLLTSVLSAVALFAAGPAFAEGDFITECDILVSHGEDPDRIAPGVDDVLLFAGRAACEDAVAKDPDNPRLRYQLGRVLFYSGEAQASLPHLEFAAEAGSEQAQFVLGYITDEGLQGIKKDPCKVEDLWVRSARQGRFAARVSYPRHVAHGKFESCGIQASPDEIRGFLTAAADQADGYYQQLLVAEVTDTYEASSHAK